MLMGPQEVDIAAASSQSTHPGSLSVNTTCHSQSVQQVKHACATNVCITSMLDLLHADN